MPETTSEQNKTLVLEAFDALLNTRDCVALDSGGGPLVKRSASPYRLEPK
jgi:hypothetical protein